MNTLRKKQTDLMTGTENRSAAALKAYACAVWMLSIYAMPVVMADEGGSSDAAKTAINTFIVILLNLALGIGIMMLAHGLFVLLLGHAQEQSPEIRAKTAYFAGKYRWVVLFFLMALGVFLYSRIPAAYADSPIQQGQLKTQFQNLIKGFGKTNYSYMREAYSGLKQFTQSGGKYSFITGVIRNISAGLGTVFVIVYFLFSIVRETQKGDTSSEMWLRTCAAAFAALFMIGWISPAMDALYGIGDYIVTTVEAAVEIDAVVGDVIDAATLKQREEAEKKMAEAFSLIPGLSGDEAGNNSLKDLLDADYEANHFAVQQAHEMLEYMEYVVYLPMLLSIFLIGTAVFELKIIQAFAPIAVATIAAEGARSPGVRLLKRYLACFLKIAIYFLIAAVGAEMTKFYYGLITKMSATTEMTPALVINLVFMLLSNAMAAMAMMQSGGLSNEIIGV